jgi:uncharacterized Zn finger protein
MTSLVIEYPCTECGHDGPHPVVDSERIDETEGRILIECSECSGEEWITVHGDIGDES